MHVKLNSSAPVPESSMDKRNFNSLCQHQQRKLQKLVTPIYKKVEHCKNILVIKLKSNFYSGSGLSLNRPCMVFKWLRDRTRS